MSNSKNPWDEDDAEVNKFNEHSDPKDFDMDTSITDNDFDSLDDIICASCGEPCENHHLLEDADFDTVLQVCKDCLDELTNSEPARFHPFG